MLLTSCAPAVHCMDEDDWGVGVRAFGLGNIADQIEGEPEVLFARLRLMHRVRLARAGWPRRRSDSTSSCC